MSALAKLRPQKGSKKSMKRIGRGDGSGHGGTSTKGHKGQLARSSAHVPRGFEGGQMPLQRRSPKWGFTNVTKIYFNIVNLDTLSQAYEDGEQVNKASLKAKGLIRKTDWPVKVLGRGALTKALKIEVDAATETAKKGIEQGKGTLKLIGAAS